MEKALLCLNMNLKLEIQGIVLKLPELQRIRKHGKIENAKVVKEL